MSATTRSFISRSSPISLRRNRPPTTSEREGILALIRQDNEIIEYLSEKATQRSNEAAQAASLVGEWKVALAEAEKRLDTATSLHEFFIKDHRTPSALDVLPSPTSESPSSAVGPRRQFDSLMAIADTYIQSTRAVVEQATLAVEEARDSVALQRDELQAAMTISMMHQRALSILQEQIQMLKKSVAEKEASFRAIWRIPGEIWRMIFEEAVNGDERLEFGSIDKEWDDGESSSCETLRLSGVCHSWRSLITSYSDLWSHIYIPCYISTLHLSRINHYYGLCNRTRLRITVVSPASLDPRCFKPLYNLFHVGSPCQEMALLIRAAGVPALNGLLPFLPPPTKLSIIRYPYIIGAEENERTPTPTIPRSYCTTIRNLEISAAGAQWLDEPVMRLEAYNIVAPPVSAIFGPHRFIPSSLQSLTSIGIQGRLYDTQPPVSTGRRTLPNIRETVMNLNFLVTVFIRHYNVPVLRRLVIPTASSFSPGDWQTFLTEVQQNEGAITDVCCYSFDDGIETLVDCLASLRQLERLELHGSCVDLVLEQLAGSLEQDSNILPSIRSLLIRSYSGDGNAIQTFLVALCPPQDSAGDGDARVMTTLVRYEKIEVSLRSCPAVSSIVLQGINELAQLV